MATVSTGLDRLDRDPLNMKSTPTARSRAADRPTRDYPEHELCCKVQTPPQISPLRPSGLHSLSPAPLDVSPIPLSPPSPDRHCEWKKKE